jgi:hypothetical protein
MIDDPQTALSESIATRLQPSYAISPMLNEELRAAYWESQCSGHGRSESSGVLACERQIAVAHNSIVPVWLFLRASGASPRSEKAATCFSGASGCAQGATGHWLMSSQR